MKNTFIFIFSLLAWSLSGQQIQKAQSGTFLLKDATLHTVTNGVIHSDLLISGGIIKQIGENITATDAKVIDCSGLRVYPGFIDGGTRLGLEEVGSVSLTKDYNEIGDFIPHMQALTAVNPNAVAIPVTRTNGITTVISKPSGGLFPGTAALIHLYGYTPDQMYAGFKGVILNFPRTGKRGRWDRRKDDEIKKEAGKAVEKLNGIWDKALLYARIDSLATAQNKINNDYNPQMDAMLPVINGEAPLMIEVNKKEDILGALKWVKEKKINNVIFTGVDEGYRVTEELAAAGHPVITGPMLSVPNRDEARYDVAYANASAMQKAGVKVALRTNEAENVRNLPFNAAYAAAYGMGIEEAVRAITIVPAEIFGLSDQLGSLEEGKIANLFICDGDPFETKTKISKLFISGYDIPMENRHTRLNDEFLERNPGLDMNE